MHDINKLGPIRVASTVDIVIERLTQAIIDGALRPGDKLPTEPDLAASFGVGRNTVREAIRTLTSYGILESRRPSGTFVCDSFKPQGINPILYGMILQKDESYEDLIGLRKVLEIGILLLLKDKQLPESALEELHILAGRIEEEIRREPVSVSGIIAADVAFHNRVAELTDNPLIILENEMLTRLTYASRLRTIEDVLKKGNHQYLIDTHYSLVEALRKKDTQQIYDALQDSYFYWKDIYK